MENKDNLKKSMTPEETLDPEDWNQLTELGHRMLEDMMHHQRTIAAQPFSMPTEEAIKEICVPLTPNGEGEERVYEVFQKHIRPYLLRNTEPRFWGWVIGTGSPYGMLAELLTGGVNSNIEQVVASSYVHQQVIEWTKELLGYPTVAGGVLVSGGSEANFTGLAVARNAKAEVDVKKKGVQALSREMTLYVSEEGHHCLDRSVEVLGLGNEALRWIPTDDDYKIKLSALKNAITEDRTQNKHPFCIIGCAGTVSSGAFDPLNSLADLAAKEKMWFHIDGAFGAWAKLSRTHRQLADGLERADSLAVDFHKWMSMPYGIGCTIVKDKRAHYSTFARKDAQYIKSAGDLVEDQLTNPHNLVLPLSRSFLSLKAYMLFRAYGKEKYCRLIQQNIDQINYLAELIRNEPEMEVTAPVASNIVCFRYTPNGLPQEELETLNKRILRELNKISLGMISDTTIKGTYMLRACNVNHRSTRKDFDYLVTTVKKIGEQQRIHL